MTKKVTLIKAVKTGTFKLIMPNVDYPRYWPEEGARIPHTGDQVLFGIALTVAGNWAHGIRMGSIGPATPAHTKLWQCAADILQAGTESLKPDHPLRTCGDEMNRVSGEHYNKAEISQMCDFAQNMAWARRMKIHWSPRTFRSILGKWPHHH